MEPQIVIIYDIHGEIDDSRLRSMFTLRNTVVFHQYMMAKFSGATPYVRVSTSLKPKRFITAIGREPYCLSDYNVYFEDIDMSQRPYFESTLSPLYPLSLNLYKYCIVHVRSAEDFDRLKKLASGIRASVMVVNDLFARCFICAHPMCGRPFSSEQDLNEHMAYKGHKKSIYLDVHSTGFLDISEVLKKFAPYNPIKISRASDGAKVYFNSFRDSSSAMEEVHIKKLGGCTVKVSAPLSEYTVYLANYPSGTTVEDIERAINRSDISHILFMKLMCFVSFESKAGYDAVVYHQLMINGKAVTAKQKTEKYSDDKKPPNKGLTLYVRGLPEWATETHVKTFYSPMGASNVKLKKSKDGKLFCCITFENRADYDKALKTTTFYGIQVTADENNFKKKKDAKKDSKKSQGPQPSLSVESNFEIVVKTPICIKESDIRIKYRPYGIKDLKCFYFGDHSEFHISFTKKNGYDHSSEVKTINNCAITVIRAPSPAQSPVTSSGSDD